MAVFFLRVQISTKNGQFFLSDAANFIGAVVEKYMRVNISETNKNNNYDNERKINRSIK